VENDPLLPKSLEIIRLATL